MANEQEKRELVDAVHSTFNQFKESNDKEIDEIKNRLDGASSEVREKTEKMNQAITGIQKRLKETVKLEKLKDIEKELEDIQTRLGRPDFKISNEDPEKEKREMHYRMLDKYCRRDDFFEHFTPEEKEEYKELRTLSDKEGGFWIPHDMANEILTKAFQIAELRPYCDVSQTGTDTVYFPGISHPTVVWGSSGVNVPMVKEKLSAGAEKAQVFDMRVFLYEHNNTLDDSAYDLVSRFSRMVPLAMAPAEDDSIVVGTGTNEFDGILTDATVLANNVITGIAADIYDSTDNDPNGIDTALDLQTKIKKYYRNAGAAYICNSDTEMAYRKRKNDNGDYYWQPSTQAGMPNVFAGFPMLIAEGMPDIGAGAYPLIFGSLKYGYALKDRAGMTVKRDESRYIEYDQTVFLFKRRVAGKVIMPEAFSVLKVAAS
jgi:HK97 family phage major capsid protein